MHQQDREKNGIQARLAGWQTTSSIIIICNNKTVSSTTRLLMHM